MATIDVWVDGKKQTMDRVAGLQLVQSRSATLVEPETAALSDDIETASAPAPKKAAKKKASPKKKA